MNRIARFLPCFLFALTSSLMSCENENGLPSQRSLSFATQVRELQSRASIVDGAEDIADFNTFTVWGNYNGEQAVFTSQVVNRSTANPTGIWEYTPPKYWVMTADNYAFSAFSPSGVGTPTVSGNMLTSLAFDSKAHQVDLMMAYIGVPKADIGKTVVPVFNHALGAVNFTFRLKPGFNYVNTYRVTDIDFDNVYTSNSFALNADNTITPGSPGGFGQSNSITQFTGEAFTAEQVMTSDYLFVIPQQSANAILRFTMDVNGEPVELVKENFSISWEMGKKTTYNITIDILQDFTITVETTAWDEPEIPVIEPEA